MAAMYMSGRDVRVSAAGGALGAVLPAGVAPPLKAALLGCAPAPRTSVDGSSCRPLFALTHRIGTNLVVRSSSPAVAESGSSGSQVQGEQPTPIVKIDNHTDPFATVVSFQFGDKLGDLADTTAALKNLGLNIRRAKIKSGGVNKFYITDAHTSEKVMKSARLEEIRLTILNNLLLYHPESGENLAWGLKAKKPVMRDNLSPLGLKNRRAVNTMVEVKEDASGSHSEVFITTTDRPGLLTDIVRVLKDISVNVISAEVDTEGAVAKDELYVTYHGDPLSPSMTQLVTNVLQYYLALNDVEREESY